MVAVEFLCVSLGLGGFHQRSTGLRHFALGFYAGCKVHNDQMRQFLVEPRKTKMVGSELWQIRASLRRFFRKWRCSEEKGSALPSLIFFYETHRSALSDQGVAALQQEIVSLTDWIRSKEQRFGCDDLKNVVPLKVNFVFFLLKHGGTRTQLCLENGILNCSLVAKRLPVDVADERNHRFGWIGEDPSFNRMNLSVLLVKKKICLLMLVRYLLCKTRSRSLTQRLYWAANSTKLALEVALHCYDDQNWKDLEFCLHEAVAYDSEPAFSFCKVGSHHFGRTSSNHVASDARFCFMFIYTLGYSETRFIKRSREPCRLFKMDKNPCKITRIKTFLWAKKSIADKEWRHWWISAESISWFRFTR